jgi:hypothetical protein
MRSLSQVSHIRRTLDERLNLGASIDAFVEKMLLQAPNTLVELIFDEPPLQHLLFWQKVIDSIDTLEQYVSAERLYLHLARVTLLDGIELLHFALNNHTEELWLIDLSRTIEGDLMGYQHLMRKRKDRNFLVWCFRYAWKGARNGLIQMAAETGDPIPASALLCVEAKEEAIQAAVKALEYNSKSRVIEYIAAAKGPDVGDVLQKILLQTSTDRVSPSLYKIRSCYSDLF